MKIGDVCRRQKFSKELMEVVVFVTVLRSLAGI
jgi:hypothetical protein